MRSQQILDVPLEEHNKVVIVDHRFIWHWDRNAVGIKCGLKEFTGFTRYRDDFVCEENPFVPRLVLSLLSPDAAADFGGGRR